MSQKDKRPPVGVGAGPAAFGKAAFSSADYTTLRAALFYIPAGDRHTWLRMGMAVKSELGDGGFDPWDEWSRTADNYDPKAARTTWRSITPEGGVTIGTLYHEAQQHGFRFNGETRPQPLPAEEIAERDRREQENEGARQRAQEDAAKKATGILETATCDPTTHPYAVKKRVPLGPLVKRGRWPQRGWWDALLVPMYGADRRLWSIEAINADGDKDFLAGGKAAGGFHPFGKIRGAGRVLIGEGVATVAVGAEVDQSPAVAALSTSNLKAVALAVRELAAPDADIIILADNDVKPDGSNPGLKAAMDAARAVGGRVAIPELEGRKCDLWDVWNEHGIEAVRSAIASATTPVSDEPQPGTGGAGAGTTEFQAVIEAAIEKLNSDIGAVFEPSVITALKAVREARPADYQRYRKRIKDAGASVTELDRLVCVSAGGEAGELAGTKVLFPEPEPWPEVVDGAGLLDELTATYRRYVVLPTYADIALALWTVHAYSYDYGRCTPILALTSLQKRCGKTTLLSVLLSMVNKPLAASNISPSCVFRSIDRWRPTLLVDEADSFLRDNEELRGIINSGHTRELAYVIRAVGDDYEPRTFSTWCPKAIALIGKLPPTLHDRAIEIQLVRKTAGESVHRLKEFDGADIRRKCARWVSDHAGELRRADSAVPPELHDRAADNWRPLVAIADLVGGEWPQRARTAAKALADGDDDTESYAVMLLADIRALFKDRKTERLFSEDIVTHLHTLEDRPWSQWGRGQKPITKNQVARLLKPFKIKPGTKREGDTTFKGYELGNFKMPSFAIYPLFNPSHRHNLRLVRLPKDFKPSHRKKM